MNNHLEHDAAFESLKAKLELGAAQAERGDLVDADQAFEQLRALIDSYRRRINPA